MPELRELRSKSATLIGPLLGLLALERFSIAWNAPLRNRNILPFCMGFAAGLYDVPLQSYLETRSRIEIRGRVLATSTSMMFPSMLISSAAFWLLRHAFHMTGGGIFMAVGVITLPISVLLLGYFSSNVRLWFTRHAP
jgi:hypothetical protein